MFAQTSQPQAASVSESVPIRARTSIVRPVNPPQVTAGVETTKTRYRLGPGDELRFNLFNHPDMKQDAIKVRSDGYASFDGVGEVYVAGKTIEDIAMELESSLADWYVEPKVSLDVVRPKPHLVYLSGAVVTPGLFQLSTDRQDVNSFNNQSEKRVDFRLSNILSAAGGVLSTADLSRIEVTHAHSNDKQVVNLWRLVKDGDQTQDLMLSSGDHVTVPELPNSAISDEDFSMLVRSTLGQKNFPVRVIGQVATPGVYDLNGISPYLNSAISRAGGFNLTTAKKRVVAVHRMTGPNSFTTLTIDPKKNEFMLRPNDVVYVAESKISKSGRAFEATSRLFSPFQNAMNTVAPLIWIYGN